MHYRQRRNLFLAVVKLVCPSVALAGQVVVDTASAMPELTGPNFAVPAGLGKQVGPNLFHSFSTLNLDRGETATFQPPRRP